MTNVTLTDTEWMRIRAFLKDDPNAYVGTDEAACRRFVEAVKWMSRSGAAWRLLPESYGQWNTTYKRFKRWCAAGVWERMLTHFASEADMENGMIDSTIVRAHPSAAGAPKNTVNKPSDEAEADSVAKSMSPWIVWAIRFGCA